SPCHPLDTVLQSAEALKDRDDIVFLFVGGGSGAEQVEQFAANRKLANVRRLPYQPYEKLSALLSAADLHLVVMGDAFRGILHPSKIYNILALNSAFIFVGPEECHVSDLIRRPPACSPGQHPGGVRTVHAGGVRTVRHGQSKEVARMISEVAAVHPNDAVRIDCEAEEFSPDRIYARFINVIEQAGAKSAAAVKPIEATAPASEG